MGIPGDRDGLRVNIVGNVDGRPHATIIHHYIMMR
jgi:hypothetical protein